MAALSRTVTAEAVALGQLPRRRRPGRSGCRRCPAAPGARGQRSGPPRSPRRSVCPALQSRRPSSAEQDVDPLERRLLLLGRLLHLVELPGALVETLGDRLAGFARRRPCPGPPAGDGTRRAATPSARARLAAMAAARRMAPRSISSALPMPDQQHPRGGARGIEHRRLVPLAGEVAGGEEPADGAAGRACPAPASEAGSAPRGSARRAAGSHSRPARRGRRRSRTAWRSARRRGVMWRTERESGGKLGGTRWCGRAVGRTVRTAAPTHSAGAGTPAGRGCATRRPNLASTHSRKSSRIS